MTVFARLTRSPFRRAVAAALFLGAALLALSPARADAEPYAGKLARDIASMERELARIETLPSDPTHQRIGHGPVLKEGSEGPRVQALTRRLQGLGYLPAGVLPADAAGSVFGPDLRAAVERFQSSQGITPDGKAGSETIAALDLDFAQAAAAIRATLPRLRELAASLPDDGVIVNLAAQKLILLRGGEVALEMDTAVGRPSRPTPLLDDEITHLILNPNWTVPPGIMAKDKLPSLRRKGNPGIANATVWLDGQVVDPASVNWAGVSPGRVRIVQSAGDHNALGRVKFQLTNDQNIYLHDTNEPKVFARSDRAVSSGCVRLARPMDLARTILAGQGWTAERLDGAVAAGKTQWVRLETPVKVRFVYLTAAIEGNIIRIYRDIYAMDGLGA